MNGNNVEARSLTWASSDETVAQVSGGWVDVTGTGAVTITASTEYGVSASVELTGVAPAARPQPAQGLALALPQAVKPTVAALLPPQVPTAHCIQTGRCMQMEQLLICKIRYGQALA